MKYHILLEGKKYSYVRPKAREIVWLTGDYFGFQDTNVDKIVVGAAAIRKELEGTDLEIFLEEGFVPTE